MDPVIVVGGGIVGTSVAYHLSRRTDVPVRLFERAGTLGSETTGKSSLGVRGYGTNETQLRMKRYGKRLYNEFLAASDGELRFEPTEVVYLATTDNGRDALVHKQANEHPLSSASEFVPGSELRDVLVLPDVSTESVTAALYRPNAGFFRAAEPLLHAFADRAESAGAELVLGTEVTDVVLRDGRVAGVVADGETHPAGAVVAAAGPWNNGLAAMAGVDVPVRQQRLHMLELRPDHDFGRPVPKLRHLETGVTFRGRPDGRVLAYRAEPAADPYAVAQNHDPDERVGVPESVKTTFVESAETVMPALATAEIEYEDVAHTSRTPDGNPVVGWTETPGFYLAATHSRGIQYGPAIGDCIARQVVDGDPTEYYQDVSITRFEEYTDCRE